MSLCYSLRLGFMVKYKITDKGSIKVYGINGGPTAIHRCVRRVLSPPSTLPTVCVPAFTLEMSVREGK